MPGDPSAEMNRMSRRIENENRRIEDMITNLQRREARYFQVFGRLEASMMQANSQMMFLEQMFWMG
jgi:flagellar capping protein FliD